MSTAELLRQNGMEMGVTPVIGGDTAGPSAPSARNMFSSAVSTGGTTPVSEMAPSMQATLAPLNGPDKITMSLPTIVGDTLREGSPVGMRVQPPSPGNGGVGELFGGMSNVTRQALDRLSGQDQDNDQQIRITPVHQPAFRMNLQPPQPMRMI